jgi:hypothetical protein
MPSLKDTELMRREEARTKAAAAGGGIITADFGMQEAGDGKGGDGDGESKEDGAARGAGGGGVSQKSVKQQMYSNMFKTMGLGEHTVVINMMVTKVGNNLRWWCDNVDIVRSKRGREGERERA